MSKEAYLNLLSKNYEEAVGVLLQKYGAVPNDYFRQPSYERLLRGEIKSIAPVRKNSGTNRGLYIHHIDEKTHLNLTNVDFITTNKYPFEYQKSDRLVYCDLIEHAVLHTIIAKETEGERGEPGLFAHLFPNIENWYLRDLVPVGWQYNCYRKSYLQPREVVEVLYALYVSLGYDFSSNIEEYNLKQQEIYEENERIEKERLERGTKERNRKIEQAKKLTNKSPRQEIVKLLFDIKYYDINSGYYSYSEEYDDFNRKMKIHIKEKLLKELIDYIEMNN